jgi:hypothetical protein
MKKIAIGCAIVLLIGFVAFVAAGFWAYRAAKPMIESASAYINQARELASISDRITNKSAYTAPTTGELTQSQVDRFLAVQTRVRGQLGDRWSQLQTHAEAVQKRMDNHSGDLSFTEFTSIFSEFANIYTDARRAQVDALNTQKFSEDEYSWVRRRVYEAAGVSLAGGIDMKQVEKMARQGSGSNSVEIPDIPMPEVPATNLALIKPHMGQIKETMALAFLGL